MTPFLDYSTTVPEAVRPLYGAGKLLASCGLEPELLTLVQLRASQLNGCALCLALHRREGEALGMNADRMGGLPAWREAPWYTDRERAAIEWSEALIRLDREHPSDELRAASSGISTTVNGYFSH